MKKNQDRKDASIINYFRIDFFSFLIFLWDCLHKIEFIINF